MQVFQLKADFNFQSFFPYDPSDPRGEEIVKADILQGRNVSKLATWVPPPIFVYKPELERGNFVHLWGFGGFAVDGRAHEVLKEILNETSELLPFLPHEGEQFHRLNVLNIVDCLDLEKSKWREKPNGSKSTQIEEYQFDPARIGGPTLFKLPKQAALLTVIGKHSVPQEFKTLVEREGLTGLKFEEIWSEGGPPIRIKSPAERLKGEA
jgi:hypothetical protein